MDSKELKTPKSPKGHWLLGSILKMKEDPILYSANVAMENDPVVLLKMMHRRLYITANAEVAQRALVADAHRFTRGSNYKRLGILGGNGLITVENGDFWKRQRRLAQPGFHKERLHSFFQCFIDFSYETSERWKTIDPNEAVPISAEMSRFTLKAVGQTLFSMDLAQEYGDFPENLKFLLRFINRRNYQFPRLPMHWPLAAHKEFFARKENLDNKVYSIIDERIQSGIPKEDLLDMFIGSTDMETGEKMNRHHIRDELFTMLVAGFETSSVALTWVWYALHTNPGIAEKMMEEVDRVVGNEPLRPDHLMQLTYIQQVISETMRLYPPVFAVPRDVGEDMDMEGYALLKDRFFLVSIYGLHHNPKYWPDPEKFDPERFSRENKEKQVKGSYMPFGSGQRICIGSQFAMMEMTALLAVMVRDFSPQPLPGYVPEMIAAITTNVTQGMPMYIRRRQTIST